MDKVNYHTAKDAAEDLEERLGRVERLAVKTTYEDVFVVDVDPDHEEQIVDVKTNEGNWKPFYPDEFTHVQITERARK